MSYPYGLSPFGEVPLIGGDEYYLNVHVVSDNGLTSPYAEKRFHVNQPLPTTIEKEPLNGTTGISTDIVFMWENVSDVEGDAVTWFFNVSTNPLDPTDNPVHSGSFVSNTTGFQFAFGPLADTYYRRVDAWDGYELTIGETWNFQHDGIPISPK